jgi:hypothetical protein
MSWIKIVRYFQLELFLIEFQSTTAKKLKFSKNSIAELQYSSKKSFLRFDHGFHREINVQIVFEVGKCCAAVIKKSCVVSCYVHTIELDNYCRIHI